MAAPVYLKTLPKSLGDKSKNTGSRKLITTTLEGQLKKKAGLWKLVKKNTSGSEATRLRKQAKALGLTVEFVTTAKETVTSSSGKVYPKYIGDIYASYQQ